MRRIPSGVTDQYIYFVAVDATDFTTRETGLSSFTVRRSRNGGASAAYTTPTINETDSSNMPGVYELLLDEDMTLDSGDHSQEVCLHITHAGMAPVTLVYELYRPDVTAGQTLTVSSGALPWNASWDAEVQSECADALNAYDPPTNAEMEARTLVAANYATASALQTVDDEIATIDGIVDAILLDTAEIGAAGAGLTALASAANLATVAGYLDTEISAILEDTGTTLPAQIAALNNLSAADVAAELATYDAPTKTEMDSAFTEIKGATWATTDTLEAIRDRGDAAWTTATGFSTLDAAGVRTAVGLASANLDTQLAAIVTDTGTTLDGKIDAIKAVTDVLPDSGALTSIATAAALATVDSNVDAIKAKTDSLTYTVAGQVDANIQYVNDVAVTGDGQSGTEWGPA